MLARDLTQIGILAGAAAGSVIYAYSRERGIGTLSRLIPAILAAYALGNVLLIMFLWLNHIAFPLNLEAMEGTVLEHLRRAMNGLPIYVEPSPEYVALAYNPLYYYLAVPFAWLFGANLFTLRLVAIVGTFCAGLVIFLAVRRATLSNWWGLIAVGLFAAAYRVMDTYLDNAHSDSWLLFAVLLGCYLIDLRRSQIVNLTAVFLLVVAFWFKQHGALFMIGGALYLTWREGLRKSLPFWLLAAALGPGIYLFGSPWPFGPRFHYFTWEVPRQWTDLNPSASERLVKFAAKSYAVLAIVGLIASIFSLMRLRGKNGIWYFMLPIALLSGFMGALDPESNNNVFILMGVWFIITGVIGLKQLIDSSTTAERLGVHLLALGVSFAFFLYNPLSVIASNQAGAAYQDLVAYLDSLDGPVYAPWIGQLQDGYVLYPAAHWVAIADLIRGPGSDVRAHSSTRRLLAPVLHPTGEAYILMNYPLENDVVLGFLAEVYELDTDLGERFAPLTTLPKRYNLGWPRYLYRYSPRNSSQPGGEGRSLDPRIETQ